MLFYIYACWQYMLNTHTHTHTQWGQTVGRVALHLPPHTHSHTHLFFFLVLGFSISFQIQKAYINRIYKETTLWTGGNKQTALSYMRCMQEVILMWIIVMNHWEYWSALGRFLKTNANEENKQVINLQLVALISIQNTHKKNLPRYITVKHQREVKVC